ncbi:MAG: nuclear transport factor 2 family protein, partial [Candidatus Binatia bacterium]
MEPFVALMRRYCIDYTNSHDLAVVDEIMEPDYVVHIAGLSLPRDAAYKPAVRSVFAQFPGLGLAVHEILTDGERLAMRFSEHAASSEGALSCWAGISLYRWNGARLTECRVEQDFLSRRRQLASRRPDELEPPHLDPWTT